MVGEPRRDYPESQPQRPVVTDVRGRPAPAVHRTDTGEYEEHHDVTVEIPKAYNLRRDRIRWGPVAAGIVTATTSMLLLGLLGLAWSLTIANPVGTGVVLPRGFGTGSAIWGAITAIVSFFLGGWIAGWSAAAFSRKWGTLNGAMVFLAGVPFILWLAGTGASSILGGIGNLTGALAVSPAAALAAIPNAQVNPAAVSAASIAARNAAWWTLVGLVLALITAAIGGALGTRRSVTVDLDRDVELREEA